MHPDKVDTINHRTKIKAGMRVFIAEAVVLLDSGGNFLYKFLIKIFD